VGLVDSIHSADRLFGLVIAARDSAIFRLELQRSDAKGWTDVAITASNYYILTEVGFIALVRRLV